MREIVDNDRETISVKAGIRRLGRSVLIEMENAKTTNDLTDAAIDIAKLTAGTDPDLVDDSSPEYKLGAAAAFAVVLSSKAETLPVLNTVLRLTKDEKHSRVFVALLKGEDSDPEVVAQALELDHYATAIMSMAFLSQAGFLEAAGPNIHDLKVTSFGEQVFWKLLPELAKTVPMDELLAAVKATLERKIAKDEK